LVEVAPAAEAAESSKAEAPVEDTQAASSMEEVD